MLSRRKFLGMAGGVAAGTAAGGGALWAALMRDHVEQALVNPSATTTTTMRASGAANNDRVLVVVQLGGGNDGLNTLIPDLGRYRDARPTLAIADAARVDIGATGYALHPSLAPLQRRWKSGQIAAFDGVGLHSQSRSHFKAMDTWWAGTDGGATSTGWLGRWLDATEAATPNPLRAIALGTGAPALVGARSLPTVVLSPSQFALRLPRATDAKAVTDAFLATAAPLSTAPWFGAAQQAIPTALDAISLLDKVRSEAPPVSDFGPATSTTAASAGTTPKNRLAGDSLSSLLQSAAGIIEMGLGTRVIFVGVSGYDTHANQLERHHDLLDDLAQGLSGFFDRLEQRGVAERVLVMTTSEFGRRVGENASGGTDHGSGGVQFVLGSAVKGKVVGEPALDRLVEGDVPIGIDARSLYALGLDWLGGPTDELLGGHFDRYSVV